MNESTIRNCILGLALLVPSGHAAAQVPPIGPTVSGFGIPGVPGFGEFELFQCPPGAMEGFWSPVGMRYLGFRWVRTDGSTCGMIPSDRISQVEPTQASFALPAGEVSFQDAMAAREFRVRMNFFQSEQGQTYYQNATEYTGRTYAAQFSVAAPARQPLPWETETLRLAFDGNALEAEVSPAAYQYQVRVTEVGSNGGSRRYEVQLAPGPKLLNPPDGAGVSGALEHAEGGSMRLTFRDRWAAYYPGEQIEISYAVRRNRRIRGDEKVYEGKSAFATAETYAMDLPAGAAKEKLKSGDEYYLRFRFRRLGGRVSTDEQAAEQEAPRIKW